jgi:transposase-like protein
MNLKERVRKFFVDGRYKDSIRFKETVLQTYKRIINDRKDALEQTIEEDDQAYFISEHLREGCTSCPFCFDLDLNYGKVDQSHVGVLRQDITCLECRKSWTVEYKPTHVKYGDKWYHK